MEGNRRADYRANKRTNSAALRGGSTGKNEHGSLKKSAAFGQDPPSLDARRLHSSKYLYQLVNHKECLWPYIDARDLKRIHLDADYKQLPLLLT